MAEIKEHYENILSEHYSWIFGGLENKIIENKTFFESINIGTQKPGIAVDLGAGSGFQSIPLAQLGFKVFSVDFCQKLLDEINSKKNGLNITTINDDILNFNKHISTQVELCICMGDTLTHLNSLHDVEKLFNDIYCILADKGVIVLSFRDYTFELIGLDRIIPVRSDENKIFTCILEYEKDYVKVYDIMYEKSAIGWELKKSFNYKLKLSQTWLIAKMKEIGYNIKQVNNNKGMIEIIALKEIC